MADENAFGGAGQFGAGEGPAGWDPAPDPKPRPTTTLVKAPLFDPATRRYPMTADGALIDEHPVIARARHLIGIRRRGIPATPGSGFPIGGLKAARPDRRQREAEDAARLALKPLLDDGDLEIVRVVLSSPFNGTFYTDVRNLRAPQERPTRLASSLQD